MRPDEGTTCPDCEGTGGREGRCLPDPAGVPCDCCTSVCATCDGWGYLEVEERVTGQRRVADYLVALVVVVAASSVDSIVGAVLD